MTNIPVNPAPTNDPTLKAGVHIGSVLTGLAAGWISTKLGIPDDPATEALIAAGVGTLVTTAVHWLQAMLAKPAP